MKIREVITESVFRDHTPQQIARAEAWDLLWHLKRKTPFNRIKDRVNILRRFSNENSAIANDELVKQVLNTVDKPKVKESDDVDEAAPPGMEDWIKSRKAAFKNQYGDDWESVLYATAWKRHNEKEEVEEKEIAGTKSGKYATMKHKPKDYLKGQRMVGG